MSHNVLVLAAVCKYDNSQNIKLYYECGEIVYCPLCFRPFLLVSCWAQKTLVPSFEKPDLVGILCVPSWTKDNIYTLPGWTEEAEQDRRVLTLQMTETRQTL